MNIRHFACGAIAVFLAASTPALAQQEIRPFVNSFQPSFFVNAHPATAYEMVMLVPGFQLTEGNSSMRGYAGALGNVLIDGRPPTNRDESLQTILGRINTASIDHIEVIRTGAQGFDFLGFPILANVVLKKTSAIKGNVSLEQYSQRHGQLVNPAVIGRMTWGVTNVLELAVTGRNTTPDSGAGYGTRYNYASDHGTVTRADEYIIERRDSVWNINASYRQPFLGGNVRVTGLFNELRTRSPLIDDQFFPVVTHSPGNEGQFRSNTEFGIQFARPLFGGDAEFNMFRRAAGDSRFQSAIFSGVEQVSTSQQYTSETTAHNVFRHKIGSSINYDGNLDLTLNTLANTVGLKKAGIPIVLPAASVHLEEKRAEWSNNFTWQVNPALALEGGLRWEISRLKQTGDSTATRILNYPKPRFKVNYRMDPTNTLRLLVTREAGQLNFNNFVTTVESKVNQVNGGNKSLRPQTYYQGEMNWEHTLKGGSLVLTARHQIITDTVDNVAILGVAGLFNATGNIGGGRLSQFVGTIVTPVGFIPGLTMQANLQYTFSSVWDPETHVKRQISGTLPWIGKIQFIKDVPAWNMRFSAYYQLPQGQNQWRYNEYQLMHSRAPETEIYGEYRPVPNWLLRVYVQNILDTRNIRKRYIWSGPRGSSPFNTIEDRRLTYGPQLGFILQYSFGQ